MIKIDGYPIDVAVSEEPTYEADVTDFPTESSADTTDHIRPKSLVLKIEGWISDTPIGVIASDPTRQAATAGKPSKAAYDKLTAVFLARKPVTVECSFGIFLSMAFQNLSPVANDKTGKALHFTGTFKQINVKTNNRTTIRQSIPGGGKKKNLGDLQAAAQAKLLDNFPIPVVSYPVSQRATLIKVFGPVLHTRRGARELDCYRTVIGGATPPDGFLTVNRNSVSSDKYDYTPYASSQSAGSGATGGGSSTNVGAKINGQPVHYDYSDATWKEDGTDKTLTHVPPGEDKWNYVTWGGK